MSERRCPFCRDDLGASLVHHCGGCNTLFHKQCATELGRCTTLGCDRALLERTPPPLTGRTIGQVDVGKVFLLGLTLAALPALGALTWGFSAYTDAGWRAWVPLVVLAGCVSCAGILPLAVGGRRGRWRYLSD